MNLFEQILQEASKARFIEKIWNNAGSDDLKNEIIRWVDSRAADPYLRQINWNWQTSKNINDLVDAYKRFRDAGGTHRDKFKALQAKRQEVVKNDPYDVFRKSELKIIENEDNLSWKMRFGMLFLRSLENENWIFVMPNSWAACRFMDSFDCGGQGAKWCIGWEQSNEYWKTYTKNGDLFILAFSKNPNPEQNDQKWMIELNEHIDRNKAWCQDDIESHCLQPSEFLNKFGHTLEEFLKIFDLKCFKQPIEIIIPKGTRVIQKRAFAEYAKLESIIIPESVIEIRDEAFYCCESLKSIDIPESVTEIGEKAFAFCTSLESIAIPEGVTKIKFRTFTNCHALKSINLPNSITEICDGAFSACKSLKSVTIPNNVTRIERCAFISCESLESINIPESVTYIGEAAFSGCNSLESIIIPNSVTEIEPNIFQFNYKLKAIYYTGTEEEFKKIKFDDREDFKDFKDKIVFNYKPNQLAESKLFTKVLKLYNI